VRHIGRRDFLIGASVLLAAPGRALSQRRRDRRVVGVLTPAQPQWREAAFRARLRELGYVDGASLVLEVLSADGRLDRMAALARELVERKPDVIVGINTPGTRAAMNETRTIPIVMAMVGDPIGLGFVTNLARPIGNVTGVSNMVGELAAKRLQLLREAVPTAERIALLYHPEEPITWPQVRDLELASTALGVRFLKLPVRTNDDIDRALEDAVAWQADAILRLAGQALTTGQRTAEQALKRRVPAMLHSARDVEAGGLISYYVDDDAAFSRVADYVDRILRGMRPSELPIEQPTRFELVVNLRTATVLGLTIPRSVLLRADRVIQ
jgi:putative ABC transport system substrate-binding protein